MIIQAFFGTAQTGVGYQFYDATGALLGARITAGIVSLPVAGGYAADATIPAPAIGVLWSTDSAETAEDLRDALTLAAADQILLTDLYTPTGSPAAVIPAAPDDPSLGTLYVYTKDLLGAVVQGVKISVRLTDGPAASNKTLVRDSHVMTTDAAGFASLALERTDEMTPPGKCYLVNAMALGLKDFALELEAETLDLSSLII